MNNCISNNPDIILIDRSLFDRLVWVDRLYLKEGMSNEEYNKYKETYIPLIKSKINIIISTYTDSLTSLKRDYNTNLSLEQRKFLNEDNINEYNKSLLNMQELSFNVEINFHLVDTTNKNQREVSFEVIDKILYDMKNFYIENIRKEFGE